MKLFATDALLPGGWAKDVSIVIDGGGRIGAVRPGSKPDAEAERVAGFLVPGMANLHSHAFQRAMAGLTEARTHPTDSFWTWRELMYRFAARITPEQVHDIAAHLYVEMLRGGFTAVAEFHYLHHDGAGQPYADPTEMSSRILAAAEAAGIALTHLPVLYAHGGFGSQPAQPAQARFLNSVDAHMRLIQALGKSVRTHREMRVGLAFHSLRAVDPTMMAEALRAMDGIDDMAPIHIHVAEQEKEVADCIAWSGERPVGWLLDHMPVDGHWCLVHATHLDAAETKRLAQSGAVAGLCPTTEANLGDGVFPAASFLGARGRFGIGTDSHIEVDAAGELRLLEYGQRLATRRRSVLADAERPSPGLRLFEDAAVGGAQALARRSGKIEAGMRADLVVLDAGHGALWNRTAAQALDSWIFAGDAACVRDVMVGGAWRIRERHHANEEALAERFRAAQAALAA